MGHRSPCCSIPEPNGRSSPLPLPSPPARKPRKTFSNHLSFPTQLDSHQIDTFVDTGAQLSVLSSKAALALGVTEAALSRDPATVTLGAAAERLNFHLHRFSHMEVGGEVVRNPALIIADVSLKDADLVLGIDFLGSQRY